MQLEHPTDSSAFRTKVVVIVVESYDVLVGCKVLYPMGFLLDYWTETVSYRPGWQFGEGRVSQLPV